LNRGGDGDGAPRHKPLGWPTSFQGDSQTWSIAPNHLDDHPTQSLSQIDGWFKGGVLFIGN
jgi:hypothetical protein